MIFLIAILISAGVGALIGYYKGRVGFGFVMGLLFGFIGWIIVAVMTDRRIKCTECNVKSPPGAKKCGHCGAPIGGPEVELMQWRKFRDKQANAVANADSSAIAVKPVAKAEIKCPHCSESIGVANIKLGNNTCPHCQRQFEAG